MSLKHWFKHIFTHFWSLLRWGPIKRNLKKVDLSRIKTWNRWKRKSVRVQSCWTNTSVAAGGDKFTDVRIRSLGSVHVGWLFVLIVTAWCSAAGGSLVPALCLWLLVISDFVSEFSWVLPSGPACSLTLTADGGPVWADEINSGSICCCSADWQPTFGWWN